MVVKRVVVGNRAIYTTAFGNPASNIINTDGTISTSYYLADTTVRADAFTPVLALNDGEMAYLAEAYFLTPEINLPGFRDATYVYQRNIF